jgi:hypothetical protein
MSTVLAIHALFGERLLPLLAVITAIWATVAWRPDQERSLPLRIFAYVISLQFLLGLVYWIYGISAGLPYLSFPFLLHPILGLLALGVAQMATRPRRLFGGLGRWAPLAALGAVLLLIVGGIVVARTAV